MRRWRPHIRRDLTTHRFAKGLLRRPNRTFHALSLGPFSVLYEPKHRPERTP